MARTCSTECRKREKSLRAIEKGTYSEHGKKKSVHRSVKNVDVLALVQTKKNGWEGELRYWAAR